MSTPRLSRLVWSRWVPIVMLLVAASTTWAQPAGTPAPDALPAPVAPETREPPVTSSPEVAVPVEPAPSTEPAPPPAAEPAESAKPPPAPEPHLLALERARFVPGKGLTVSSRDKEFELALRLRAQFLYTVLDEAGEDVSHALQIRRARVQFGGYVFGEHNTYKTELAISPRDENVGPTGPRLTPLLDWYAEFTYLQNAHLRIGQYKVPFSRQRVISSGDLQLVDRALAQGEFNLDRDVGLHLFSPDLAKLGLFRYYAGVWINEGRDADDFRNFDMMYIARVEVLPFGMFSDYKEADLERRAKPGLSIGLAYAYLDDALRDRGILGSIPADEGTTDVHVMTADAMFKQRGLSLFGELFYRASERNPGDAVDDMGVPIPTAPARDGLGWFVQGGYVLPGRPIELAARYSGVRPTGDDSALEQEHEVGGGLSWYPGGHSLKLQGDYFHGWGDALPQGASDQFRVQLQVAY